MPGLKLIALIVRRRGLDLASFSAHWRTTHRELIMRLVKTGIIKGYVQNHRDEPQLEGLSVVADGSPELWMESLADMARIRQSPEYMEGAYLDEPNFMEGRSRLLIAEEATVVDGPGQQAVANHLKLMLFFRRAATCTVADFSTLYRRAQTPLVMPRSAPARLSRQRPLPAEVSPAGSPIYDLAEFSWWPDRATLAAAWRERQVPAEIDASAMCGLLVREEPCLWPSG